MRQVSDGDKAKIEAACEWMELETSVCAREARLLLGEVLESMAALCAERPYLAPQLAHNRSVA